MGEVGGEPALPLELDEQLGSEMGHHGSPLDQHLGGDDLRSQGLEVELAVSADANRAVGIRDQGFEVVEEALISASTAVSRSAKVAGIFVSSMTSPRWTGHASTEIR